MIEKYHARRVETKTTKRSCPFYKKRSVGDVALTDLDRVANMAGHVLCMLDRRLLVRTLFGEAETSWLKACGRPWRRVLEGSTEVKSHIQSPVTSLGT